MIIIGIATPETIANIRNAGYTISDQETAMGIFELELPTDEEIAVIHVDCDPTEALWPTLCPCGGLRDITGTSRASGFVTMRCERCGSTVEYRETMPE